MGLEINLGKTYTKDQTGKLVAGKDKKLDADTFKAGVKRDTVNFKSVFDKLDGNGNAILDQAEIDELKGDLKKAIDKKGNITQKGMKYLQEKYGIRTIGEFASFLQDVGVHSANIGEPTDDSYVYNYKDDKGEVVVHRDKETGQQVYGKVSNNDGQVYENNGNGYQQVKPEMGI